ncbi:MAG: hypothetical protein WAU53_14890, partial [Rhodoplanes sp.]
PIHKTHVSRHRKKFAMICSSPQNIFPKDRLGSTDDCGFSPFSIDVKPKHGSPDVARDIAFQKIRSRVEGTRMGSERLGIPMAA